jgi:hypothetical protein
MDTILDTNAQSDFIFRGQLPQSGCSVTEFLDTKMDTKRFNADYK